MRTATDSSWLARRVQGAVRLGLTGAYRGVTVDSAKYLVHLSNAYGLPVRSFGEMPSLHPNVLDHIASRTIAGASKLAALEGAGVGLGGILSIIPDVSFLSAMTFRTIQKLSLIYGFEYSTEDETAELWIATASAAGVDLGKDLIDKQLVERFVPRVIERIALRAGSEVAEKWVARVVPLVSSVLGGTLNYYFIRGWGSRAQKHFRDRRLFTSNMGSNMGSLPTHERALAAHGPQATS